MAGIWSDTSRTEGFLAQVLPVMALLAVGSLATGGVFRRMEPLLREFPGLVVLVPPLIGLRGNINTSLGSRLSSATHLGLVDPTTMRGPEVRENVLASLTLSATMPTLAAVLAWGVSVALGLPVMPLGLMALVAAVAGLASGAFLAAVTLALLAAAHRYGLDPDNVTGPALATVGDVVTLALLYGAAATIGGWY